MTYQLFITRSAQKELAKLEKDIAIQLKYDIELLSSNPRPAGCKKLKDRTGWRIRSGNYRVIYEINEEEEKIYTLHIGHRKDVYKSG